MDDPKSAPTQDQCDIEVTMPLKILRLIDDISPCAEEDVGSNPYNTEIHESGGAWPSRRWK